MQELAPRATKGTRMRLLIALLSLSIMAGPVAAPAQDEAAQDAFTCISPVWSSAPEWPQRPDECPNDVIGIVRRADTGEPIGNAEIYSGSFVSKTGTDGWYRVGTRFFGHYSISASATGCVSRTKGTYTNAANFVLGPNRVDFDLNCD